jgi:hypothetical protein
MMKKSHKPAINYLGILMSKYRMNATNAAAVEK